MVLDWKWFRRSERRGFSLIEIAAFISIFTVMTYYAGAVTGQGFKSLRKVKDHSAACNLARAQLEAITFSQGDQTIAYDPVLRPELKINNIEYSVTIKATPNINGDAQLKRFDVTVNWRNAVNGAKGAYTLATYISSYPRVVPAGRLVTITNRNSYALTDHQVLLTVNTRAFVSAGTMRSDGNDIRFYDPEGNPLPYWIEEDPLAARHYHEYREYAHLDQGEEHSCWGFQDIFRLRE
jgi:Tfp pilus assembly protein FimT